MSLEILGEKRRPRDQLCCVLDMKIIKMQNQTQTGSET